MPKVISSPLTQVIDRMREFRFNHHIHNDIYKRYSNDLRGLGRGSVRDISDFISEMLSRGVFPNSFLISQLIKMLGNKKAIDDAIALHHIAVDKGVANKYTYSSTIDAIANNSKPDPILACRLLEEAKYLGFADIYTYNNTIDAITKSERPNAIDACRLLKEAKDRGFANAITYARTIAAIAKSERPDARDASLLLEEAKALGFANTITYNSTIAAISKSEQPDAIDACRRLLEEAKALGFANAITYNSTIAAISKSERPNARDAVLLLEDAKALGFANAITYNSTIDAIAKSERPNAREACRLLEEAKARGFANAITYTCAIAAIAKSERPDEIDAVPLLEEAKAREFADAITYICTIDAIAKSKHPNESVALSLLDEATRKYSLLDMRVGDTLDLHGLSFGMVYFGLKRRLEKELETYQAGSQLQVIYGQGLHSQLATTRLDLHPLKAAVNQVILNMPISRISGREDPYNPGLFTICLKPYNPQLIGLARDSLFHPPPMPDLEPKDTYVQPSKSA